jgi:hypothetical protein
VSSPFVVRIRAAVRFSAASWLLYGALGLVAAIFLYAVMTRGDVYFGQGDPVGRVFDEGVDLSAAARVLAGQVPYRDFSLIYAPGQSYALAAVFMAVGPSMGAARGYDLVVRVLLCLSVYALAREVSSAKVALVPYAVAVVLLGSAYFYGYPMFPALLLSFSSATLCLVALRGGGRWWLFSAGLLAGAAGIFRHDVGVYVIGSEALLLLLRGLAGKPPLGTEPTQLSGIIRRSWQSVWPFLAGIGTAVAPPGLFLLATVPFGDLWYAFVAFPLGEFRSAFSVPVPDAMPPVSALIAGDVSWEWVVDVYTHSPPHLLWVNFWTQPIIIAVGLFYVAMGFRALRSGGGDGSRVWSMALVTFLAAALLNQGINRVDVIHLLPSGILVCICLAGLAHRGFAVPRLRAPTAIGILAAVVIMAPSYVRAPLSMTRAALTWEDRVSCAEYADLVRAACVFTLPEQAEAAMYIRTVTRPDEPIFVGNVQHDRIVPNDALFYFVAARPNATRYDDLIAGLVATERTQSSIIADLEQKQVRWVVLTSRFKDEVEPNAMGRPTGVTMLDDYIRAKYVPAHQVADYVIWTRA